jgi:[acyl-carrier-protein] S-malonyltransferase
VKVAFLYPGQGSQRVGMGAALRTTDGDVYDRHLTAAEQATELPLRRLIEHGPIDELTRTEVSQPAMFALSLALTEVAARAGVSPDLVAGHSLGELTAAAAAGVLGESDGLRLVAARSRAMARTQAAQPGAMAAVVGLGVDEVAALCGSVEEVCVANHNATTQVVISGSRDGVQRACGLATSAGARAVPLNVGGAFHSSAMQPARDALAALAGELTWRAPRVPVASNALGRLLCDPDEIREAIVAQVAAPVRWVDCLAALSDAGVTHALELGPGRVLTGLARSADRSLVAAAADSREKIEAFAVSTAAAGALSLQ